MNSGHIDLIYLDPPFNSNHNYAAPIGSKAAGAAFKDTWTLQDIDDAWHGYIAEKHPGLYSVIDATGQVHGDSMKSYLIYMAIRILEMKRLLKPTGSIYLHCDPTAGHYLKLVMDAIFERKNFRNEIIWSYRTGGASKRNFAKKHDVILFYSNSNRYVFNPLREKSYTKAKSRKAGLVVYGIGRETIFEEDEKGVYAEVVMRDVWDISYINSQARERTGYPTQKPLALLKRIIEASSDKQGIVFDPFCGCATTCVAAQILGRKWVACDIEKTAGKLIKKRMDKELGMFFDGKILTELPSRTRNDLTNEENELFGDVKIDRYNSRYNKYKLYGQQGGICNGCAQKFDFKIFEVDHINPRSNNGTDHISNLQLLCPPCNRSKGGRPMKEFLEAKKAEMRESLKLLDGLSS